MFTIQPVINSFNVINADPITHFIIILRSDLYFSIEYIPIKQTPAQIPIDQCVYPRHIISINIYIIPPDINTSGYSVFLINKHEHPRKLGCSYFLPLIHFLLYHLYFSALLYFFRCPVN